MGKKCQPGCSCGHHRRTDYEKCQPGCTCKRHFQTEEHRRKNSEANTGRKMSPEALERRVASRREKRGGSYQDPETQERMYESLRSAIEADPTKRGGYEDGRSSHPEYNRWYNMVARCTKPQHPEWVNYGARGVTIHEPWRDDPFLFYAYLDTLGECPDGYSLDRIDNDGNYEPGNLRWADKSTQRRNARSQYVNLK